LRDRQAERLGGLEIDDQLKSGRLLDRQIGRLLAFQYSSGVNASLAIVTGDARSIADQTRRGLTSIFRRNDEASRSYFARMRMVGLKILKNKLSEYVRLVAAGETIVVTDRNRVVAEIVPPRTGLTPFEEQGVREGWLRPARIRDGTPPPRKPVKGMSFEQLMTDLDRDREDR